MSSAHHIILCSAPDTYCLQIAQKLLMDERFIRWPSSIDKHHFRVGGNLKHTSEVIEFALKAAEITNQNRAVNIETVYLSALIHDYGKIYAYEETGAIPNTWKKVENYTPSYHIEKSIEKVESLMKDSWLRREIIHCIGAHHCRIEWGSLWEPKTPEAWILHLADMLSVFAIENRPNR